MIAVTGIGMVSPYGVGIEAYKDGCMHHQALNPVEHFDAARYGLSTAGGLRDFVAKNYIPPMKARRMSRFSHMSVIASQEAWRMSGLSLEDIRPENAAVIVGTGLGSVSSTDSFFEGLVLRGPAEMNPMIFPETVQNIAAAHISIEIGIKGPNTTFSQGDVSGEFAIFYGVDLLRKELTDAVLVCGTDELTEPVLAGIQSLKIVSEEGRLAPFDRRRDGLVPGEGAAALILERAEDAGKRGATILGYIGPFSIGSDAVERYSYASADAMAYTMEAALKGSNGDPGFISASANSTVQLDREEALAVRKVFGSSVPVTSLKSQTGSFMSAGVMKTAASLIHLGKKKLPPVYGLTEPEIGGVGYIMDSPLEKISSSCLVNGFSHGGSNVSIMITAAA